MEEIVVGNVETITESSLGVLQMDTDVPQDISAIETIQTTIIKEELEIDDVPKDSTEEVQQEKKKTEKMATALGKPESTTRSQPQLIPDNSSVQDPKITTATNKTITTKPPYTTSNEIPLKPRRTVRGDIVSYFLDKIVDVVTVDSSTTTSVYSTDSQPEDIEFEDLVLEYLKNIKCSECAAVMDSLEKYVSHFLGEHPKEHFYVSCCHIRFRKLNILKHHLRQHKDVGYNHVTMPKDKAATNNKAPTAVTAAETTKETHKRKLNPKVFSTSSSSILDTIHTERSSHSDCVICGKKFVNGNALDFHYRDIHCIVGGSKTVAAKVRRNR